MRKILFVLNYRAGTNLFRFVSGKRSVPFSTNPLKSEPLVNSEVSDSAIVIDNWKGTSQCFFLPTIPSGLCPCENYFARGIEDSLALAPPTDYFAWQVHIGDWWGEAKSADVPGPYDIVTPVRFGVDELRALPGSDWKIIYIVRDGRNQIESLRSIPDGIEADRLAADPDDYFEVLCKAFRNRARLAIDAEQELAGFRIFRFEDLVENPVNWMQNVYDFIELPLNRKFVQQASDLTISSRAAVRHSSFSSRSKLNERWYSWTDREKNIFEYIAGNELRELGYA